MTKIEYRSKGQNRVYREQTKPNKKRLYEHTHERPSHIQWYLTL